MPVENDYKIGGNSTQVLQSSEVCSRYFVSTTPVSRIQTSDLGDLGDYYVGEIIIEKSRPAGAGRDIVRQLVLLFSRG